MKIQRLKWAWQYYTRVPLQEKAFITLFNYIQFKQDQFDRFIQNGQILEKFAKNKKIVQDACSHRKGGYVNLEVGVFEHGTDDQYAVCKHQLPFGDWIVKCLRCGKKWTKPDQKDFKYNSDFQFAYLQYKEAIYFPTRNVASTSIQFQKFEKKSLQATLKIVWSILKRDITLWSSLRDNPENVTMRLT